MSDIKKIGEFTPERLDVNGMPEDVLIALCAAIGDGKYPESDGKGPLVLLVINGKQFPFVGLLQPFAEQYDQLVKEAGRRVAAEKMKLSAVADRLDRLEHVIQGELDELFPDTRRDDY